MLTLLFFSVVSAAPAVSLEASVDGGAFVPGWVYARRGQRVELRVRAPGPVRDVRWLKIEPEVGAVDNTAPSFHFEPIAYRETPLPACEGRQRCPADVTPTALPAVEALPGVGTMAFAVEVTLADGRVLRTPGREVRRWGGLGAEVFRVTFRRDDSLLGYATELLNTPYIFGSAGPDGRNQTDLLIGSDCADFVVYARRRSGVTAAYTSSWGLDAVAKPLREGAPVRAGDVLHFTDMRHVAFLYEDRPPLGQVGPEDLILHTCWAPPTVERLRDTACASGRVRVLRFGE